MSLEFVHDFPMANSSKRKRRLTDAYAFPGFRPQPMVRGVFGDPKACVIDLVRRSKKHSVAVAAEFKADGTTDVRARRAICPAATGGFTWSSRSGVSCARVAAK